MSFTTEQPYYDYIIVGAGAAGCIVANRLSKDPSVRVCVLEAGPPDKSLFIKMPAGFVKMVGNPRYTWNFPTEPTPFTGGRAVPLIQGKTLGGGTSINGMAYNRGQPGDFDAWEASGNPGWGYRGLLPYFRALENRQRGDAEYRGSDGPIPVNDVVWDDPLCHAFIDAVEATGTPRNSDINGFVQAGVSFSQANIHQGRRVSAAAAFLDPIRQRPNLTVVTNALVSRILFQERQAIGVALDSGEQIRCRKEVIVCCGAINTPRLLQVSGIGAASLLDELKVPQVLVLPGVGANLQDHYMVQIVARGKGFISINQAARGLRLWREALRWSLKRPSLLGLPVALVHYFMKSGFEQGDADLQGIFTPASHLTGETGHLDDCIGMTCAVWQHRPLSRGYVRARSTDMSIAPVVQPNYLDHEQDRCVLLRGCAMVRQILAAPALKPYVEEELSPGASVDTPEQWLAFAARTGSTVFHPVGTARMGPSSDPDAVVDHTLRVHGLQGIRVIDASIMPTLTSANTAVATMALALKGADLILNSQVRPVASDCELHPERIVWPA